MSANGPVGDPKKEVSNPANVALKKVSGDNRIPMSVPQQKLQVPDIPGFHLHWMRGTPQRIAQALRAGYEFVQDDEIDLVNFDLGGGPGQSGNTDMGTRVSVVAGGDDMVGNQPARLFLMKLRQEWWEADQRKLADRNEQIAEAIRGGNAGEEKDDARDRGKRYMRTQARNLFTKRAPEA